MRTIEPALYTKANWIAKEYGYDVDDIYDVLLGNITIPSVMVAEVESASGEYDELRKNGSR